MVERGWVSGEQRVARDEKLVPYNGYTVLLTPYYHRTTNTVLLTLCALQRLLKDISIQALSEHVQEN